MFDGLRDVNDIEMRVVIEDIVFGKISVDEFALLIHLANAEEEFLIEVGIGGRGDLGFRILESR